jgi:two-component system LytT family sensor kinase
MGAMHDMDSTTFPSFWKLQAIGWLSFYALVLVEDLRNLQRQPELIWTDLLTVAPWFLMSCPLRPICRALLRRRLSWTMLELQTIACAVALGSVASALGLIAASRLNTLDWAGLTLQAAVALFFWCNLYFTIKQWDRSIQERERLLRAEAEARTARLSALRYQLNPHFLFNSLNAVTTLILEENVTAATRMLAHIADLLRTSLDDGLKLEVPLAQEIAFTERYLAIEQIRLGERLQVEMSIQAQTLDALVPSLLLQPLVENAVRHGVAPAVAGGRISIHSQLHNFRVHLIVRNSGARRGTSASRQDRARGGIGLANTTERLRSLYGNDHSLMLQWPETGGCEVTIELPWRTVPEHREMTACVH